MDIPTRLGALMTNGWIKRLLIALGAIAAITVGGMAIGHSGGLDKAGCHHDHKNGGYHCH